MLDPLNSNHNQMKRSNEDLLGVRLDESSMLIDRERFLNRISIVEISVVRLI